MKIEKFDKKINKMLSRIIVQKANNFGPNFIPHYYGYSASFPC